LYLPTQDRLGRAATPYGAAVVGALISNAGRSHERPELGNLRALGRVPDATLRRTYSAVWSVSRGGRLRSRSSWL
jgi:hypothetical protein